MHSDLISKKWVTHLKWVALSALFTLTSLEAEESPSRLSNVRVIPVHPTPESQNIQTSITFPINDQVVSSSPINLQMQLRGFPLGTKSDFEMGKLLPNDPQGQNIRVIVDDYPPFGIYKTFVDALDDNNIYFDKTLNENIPFQLGPGVHYIRAFPVRSYGESLKNRGCFSSSTFFVGEKVEGEQVANLCKPFLTYNEPQGSYCYQEGKPLLLDFYVTNTELSKDGYKVRLTIDRVSQRTLVFWIPYYIYGLSKGTHTIKLELIDPDNQVVPGPFNSVEKEVILD